MLTASRQVWAFEQLARAVLGALAVKPTRGNNTTIKGSSTTATAVEPIIKAQSEILQGQEYPESCSNLPQ